MVDPSRRPDEDNGLQSGSALLQKTAFGCCRKPLTQSVLQDRADFIQHLFENEDLHVSGRVVQHLKSSINLYRKTFTKFFFQKNTKPHILYFFYCRHTLLPICCFDETFPVFYFENTQRWSMCCALARASSGDLGINETRPAIFKHPPTAHA